MCAYYLWCEGWIGCECQPCLSSGVLATIALIEGVRRAKAYIGYEVGLPLYSMAVAMSGVGSAPQLLAQKS